MVFEIASKYCISDSFVDHDGHSISSEGFLPAVGGNKRSYPASAVRGSDKRSYPVSEVKGGDERSYPASEVGGGSWEEIPNALKPEARGSGWEELSHAQGQGQWPGGPTPRPRSCAGAGGPRGAIPC